MIRRILLSLLLAMPIFAQQTVTITTRAGKGQNLTPDEMDANLSALRTGILTNARAFVVASQAAMLATTAQAGDFAVRTDSGNAVYVLVTTPASTLGNWASVGGAVTSVAGRTGAVTLTISDISGGAPLASPTFTGTPAAPTAAPGTNTTQLATTAFVATSYAPLASPGLTGSPTAPTASAGDSSTKLATTSFVQNAVLGEAGTESNFYAVYQNGATAGNITEIGGTTITKTGTHSFMTPATTTYIGGWQRTKIISVSTSAGVSCSYLQTCNSAVVGPFFVSTSGARIGGFKLSFEVALATNVTGERAFFGLYATNATVGNAEPSSKLNLIGIGFDGTDANSGNWFVMRNDGSGTATRVDLGSNAPRDTSTVLRCIISADPNSATFYVKVVNLTTGTTVIDTSYNTDVPTDTFLSFHMERNNGSGAGNQAGWIMGSRIMTAYDHIF